MDVPLLQPRLLEFHPLGAGDGGAGLEGAQRVDFNGYFTMFGLMHRDPQIKSKTPVCTAQVG